jgi:hypothetical protein
VDGHDILISHGRGYQGARRISDGAYGYKLLVLLNIQEDCELIVRDESRHSRQECLRHVNKLSVRSAG